MTPAIKAAADRVRARNPEGVSLKSLRALNVKVEKAIKGLDALAEATEGHRDVPVKVARAQFYLKPAATLLRRDAESLEAEAEAK